jgi:putative transposase
LALAKQKIIKMPFTKVYIHYIWSTKNREHLITDELKPLLLKHIKENSIKKDIYITSLNCVSDHIHILVSLGKEQTIAKTAMLIKGESSYWINKEKLSKFKFEWQDEYIAISVQYNSIQNVVAYIGNQEEHHKKKNFSDEYNEFIKEIEDGSAKAGDIEH